MRWPVDSPRFGRAFGWRIHPTRHVRQFHQGQDITNNSGSPLYAVADGVVYTAATVRQNPGGGNFLGIKFPDGSRCRYFHMRDAPRLKVGDRVREGDVVGYLGNTGTWTTGPHLHFEVSDHKGVAVDPRAFIESRLTSQVSNPTNPTESEEDDMFTDKDRELLAAIAGKASTIEKANTRAGDAATRASSIIEGQAALAASVAEIVRELPKIRQTHTRAGDAATRGTLILKALAESPALSTDEAASIASLVVLQLSESAPLSGLSDDDVSKLATAAADEADRRERERLG